MRTAAQAVAAARAATRNRDDMCLAEVQGWYAAPWAGPHAENAWHRWGGQHPADRRPPPGAPVYFHSPQHRYGHIALAVPGPPGTIRSTDWPRDTYVGTTTITEMEARWGVRYLGWADRFSGGPITFTDLEDDDMPLTNDDVARIADAVWDRAIKNHAGDEYSAAAFLREASDAPGKTVNYRLTLPDGEQVDLWAVLVDTHTRVKKLGTP